MAGADAVIHSFEAHGYSSEHPIWHLRSKEAYIFQKDGLTHVFGVNIDYYGSDGKVSTFIKGEKGLLDKNKGTMRIEGNVEVVSQNGKKLTSDYLIWFDKEKKLKTDAPVRIETPEGDIIRGRSLIADQKLDKLVLNAATGISRPRD